MKRFENLIEDYKNNVDNLIHKEIINLGYKPKIADRVILEDIKEFLIANNIHLQVDYAHGEKSLKGINAITGEILFEYKNKVDLDLKNFCATSYFVKVK